VSELSTSLDVVSHSLNQHGLSTDWHLDNLHSEEVITVDMKTESSQMEQTTEMTTEMYDYATETSTQGKSTITTLTDDRTQTLSTGEYDYEASSVRHNNHKVKTTSDSSSENFITSSQEYLTVSGKDQFMFSTTPSALAALSAVVTHSPDPHRLPTDGILDDLQDTSASQSPQSKYCVIY